eukprot:255551_1
MGENIDYFCNNALLSEMVIGYRFGIAGAFSSFEENRGDARKLKLIELASIDGKIQELANAALYGIDYETTLIQPRSKGAHNNYVWYEAILKGMRGVRPQIFRKWDSSISFDDYFFSSKPFRSRLPVRLKTLLKEIIHDKKFSTEEKWFLSSLIKSHSGGGEHGVIVKFIWLACLKDKFEHLYRFFTNSYLLFSDGRPSTWLANMKPFEIVIRESFTLCDLMIDIEEQSAISYISTLTGWINGKADWFAEIEKRRVASIVHTAEDALGRKTTEAWEKIFTNLARCVIGRAGINTRSQDILTYMERLYSISTTGSATIMGKINQTIFEDKAGKVVDDIAFRVGLTKGVLFENDRFKDAVLKAVRFAVGDGTAKIMGKNELGKDSRMIATGSIAAYVTMYWLLSASTTDAGFSWSVQNAPSLGDVRMIFNTIMSRTEDALETDYEDYNYHHELSIMFKLW